MGPVIIGISLGFTLSLLSVNWTEEACYADQGAPVGRDEQPKGARKPNSISVAHDAEFEADFEPRILPYKQVEPSTAKKVFRCVSGLQYLCFLLHHELSYKHLLLHYSLSYKYTHGHFREIITVRKINMVGQTFVQVFLVSLCLYLYFEHNFCFHCFPAL